MGYVTQWERFGAGAEYEVKVEKVEEDRWWLMVGQQYSPAGYAWIFPLGNNIVRIGVGVGKPDSTVDPTQRLKEIMEKKMGPIKDLGEITPIEFHYGLIPNDGLSRKTVFNNLILVGDTAGTSKSISARRNQICNKIWKSCRQYSCKCNKIWKNIREGTSTI